MPTIPTLRINVPCLGWDQTPDPTAIVRVFPANAPILRTNDGGAFTFGVGGFLRVSPDPITGIAAVDLPVSGALFPSTTAFIIQVSGLFGGAWSGLVPDPATVTPPLTLQDLITAHGWQITAMTVPAQLLQTPPAIADTTEHLSLYDPALYPGTTFWATDTNTYYRSDGVIWQIGNFDALIGSLVTYPDPLNPSLVFVGTDLLIYAGGSIL